MAYLLEMVIKGVLICSIYGFKALSILNVLRYNKGGSLCKG